MNVLVTADFPEGNIAPISCLAEDRNEHVRSACRLKNNVTGRVNGKVKKDILEINVSAEEFTFKVCY